MQDKKDKVRDMSAYDMLVITPLATMVLLWLFTYMSSPRLLGGDEAAATRGGFPNACTEKKDLYVSTACSGMMAWPCDTWCDPCAAAGYQGGEPKCTDTYCWRCNHDASIFWCTGSDTNDCRQFGSGNFTCGSKWRVKCDWDDMTHTCSCPKNGEKDVGMCLRDDCVGDL